MRTAPDPIRRLACLGGADHRERLRLSRKDARQLEMLLKNRGSGAGPAELAYRFGEVAARDLILLDSAASETLLPVGMAEGLAHGAAACFPVRPKDLMPGLKGAALGARLKELEARWIASGFTLTRAELLA